MNLQVSGDRMIRKISVAIIEPVGGHGGMHYYDFGLCRGLLTAGCRVSLYTCDETADPAIPGLCFHPFYRRIYGPGNRWLRGLRFVRCTLASIRHAVASGDAICHFHAFNHITTDLAVITIANLFRRKVVLTVHDVDSLAGSKTGRSRVTGWIYRLADRVIAHNKVSVRELEKIGVDRARIALIAHGHYLEDMSEIPSMPEARRALGIKASAKVILFFGQIKHSKGLDILIGSLPQVAREIPEVVVLIAGRPWKADFARYDALIDHLNVRTHCRLRIGFIPDDAVSGYYAAADLVALPYRRIYQSGVLLMAMTYGRPAVVSDLPGMREIVTDGLNGYVFENESKDELARVLIRALRDEPGRRQVAARASDYIRQHHDWSQIGARTLDVYREVLLKRRIPPT
jgi:glycosyltransferase involved in cell wall biosynthesis